MNIFVTFGTADYLQTIVNKYPEEKLILMQQPDKAMLLHETEGNTLFNEGRHYEVLDAVGSLEQGTFAALNNIPVTEEGRPLFEYRFNQRARLIEQEPGFTAIRVLRPMNSDTYIILTMWDKEESFKKWQESKAYEKAHQKRDTPAGEKPQPSIFSGPSYIATYHIELAK